MDFTYNYFGLILYFGVIIIVGGGFLIFWMVRRSSRRNEIWRSLNLELLFVAFPRMYDAKNQLTSDQLREKISMMENVFANLKNVKDSPFREFWYGRPSFSLELSVAHIGEEISFYVAVPKRLSGTVEKIIQGVFPESQVTHVPDYNMFNPDGVSVASEVVFSKNQFLPIRTYRTLPSDPMRSITNAFSKLAEVGEGAAFQLVAVPAPAHWTTHILTHAKDIFLAEEKRGFADQLKLIATAKREDPTKPKLPKEPKKLTPQEEEMVRTIEAKANKILFSVNIRLVASAPTEARAREILHNLEGNFAQFTDPHLNSFKTEERKGSNLKDFLYKFSFRVFDPARQIILNSEEMASLYHFPNVPLETPKIHIAKAKEALAPTDISKEGIVMGYNLYRGVETPIRFLEEDRRRHLYVIGQTGTGKTVFLENCIRQDIESGKGVCFIDPHGDTVEKILSFVPQSRMDDVIYFNPGDVARPMGLNMLEYDARFPEQKTLVVNELFSIFLKLYGAIPESMGPMFEQYFRNAALLVMEDPFSGNTLLDVERVMVDKPFRDLKLSHCNNVVVKTFWQQIAEKAGGESSLQNMVPYITSKFDTFLANEIMRPIIAQEKSAFNFRDVMDKKKILLINLSKGKLGELNSSLIGLIMVGKLLLAALSRADVSEGDRSDFYLYIDEFQNVTTPSIATILSEARKYRLDLTLSHQFIGQLEESIKKAVFGNVGSMVAFRIGSDDAEFMTKQFAPVFTEDDLLNIDNYNCYVKLLIRGKTSSPFSMKTYPPVQGDQRVIENMKSRSALKYGRPREEVEAEIIARHSSKLGSDLE